MICDQKLSENKEYNNPESKRFKESSDSQLTFYQPLNDLQNKIKQANENYNS